MKTPLPASSAPSSAAAADELDLAFWNSVKDSYWREELQAYLDQHSNGETDAATHARNIAPPESAPKPLDRAS
jgi:hypothetical protein